MARAPAPRAAVVHPTAPAAGGAERIPVLGSSSLAAPGEAGPYHRARRARWRRQDRRAAGDRGAATPRARGGAIASLAARVAAGAAEPLHLLPSGAHPAGGAAPSDRRPACGHSLRILLAGLSARVAVARSPLALLRDTGQPLRPVRPRLRRRPRTLRHFAVQSVAASAAEGAEAGADRSPPRYARERRRAQAGAVLPRGRAAVRGLAAAGSGGRCRRRGRRGRPWARRHRERTGDPRPLRAPGPAATDGSEPGVGITGSWPFGAHRELPGSGTAARDPRSSCTELPLAHGQRRIQGRFRDRRSAPVDESVANAWATGRGRAAERGG